MNQTPFLEAKGFPMSLVELYCFRALPTFLTCKLVFSSRVATGIPFNESNTSTEFLFLVL